MKIAKTINICKHICLCSFGWVIVGTIPRSIGVMHSKSEFFYPMLFADIIITASFCISLYLFIKLKISD
jgi:hypothetical protein